MTYDPHASAAAETGSQSPDPDQIVHQLELHIADLERQLADALALAHEPATAGHVVTSFDELDEGELAALVGEETAKVLAAARNAAAGIVANAERTASQMRGKADRDAERVAADAEAMIDRAARDADTEAARRLAEADTAIGLAHAEAEQHALKLRTEAEAAVADIQVQAQRRIDDANAEAMRITDAARGEARALVEQAGAEGRALVSEAQEVRARMLEDLLRRRKLLRRQVEQLHAGRERLAQAFDVVHDSMRSIDLELGGVLAEAKAAAEQAAALADETSDPATDELEAMVHESRAAAGLDTVADEETGLEPEAEPEVAPATDDAASLFSRLKADAPAGDPAEEPAAEPAVEVVEFVEVVAVEPAPAPADITSTVREPNGSAAVEVRVVEPPAVEAPAVEAAVIEPEAEPAETVTITDAITVQRDGLVDELTRSVVRKMKRLLTDEQNEVLDTIRRQPPLPELDELLAPESEHIRRYAEATLPALRNTALAGGELPAALHADRPGGPGAAAKTAKRGAAARSTQPTGDVSVRDLAAVLAVDVVGALREKLEACMAGSSAETLRAPTGSGASAGSTVTKAARSAAADDLCDQVRLAYREVRNRKVDAAAGDAVRHAFARGIRSAPEGPPAELVGELLAGLPAD